MNNFLHSAMVDEDYLVIGAHVDESIQSKILANKYVDFARLLPCNCLSVEEDHRMEMINKGGMSFWVPVADREHAGAISGFGKWEQAFRVFSNIYNTKFPERVTELIQYNHIIHTAAQTYVWENVYQYDKEFRLHISHHPQRSWSIILQQAWDLKLKEKLTHNNWETQGVDKKSRNLVKGSTKANVPMGHLASTNTGAQCPCVGNLDMGHIYVGSVIQA